MFLQDKANLYGYVLGAISGVIPARDDFRSRKESVWNNVISLTYVFEGKDLYKIDDDVFEAGKDCLIIAAPHSRHQLDISIKTIEPLKYTTISFFTCNTFIEGIRLIDASLNPKIKELFIKINSIYSQKKRNYHIHMTSVFFRILEELCYIEDSMHNEKFSKINKAIWYIHDHCFEQEFYCGILPEICGMKHSYFNRLFMQKFNTTPTKYVTSIRMERAENMIMDKNNSIADIAEKTGYQSISYFSRVFKDYFGVAPSMYNPKM